MSCVTVTSVGCCTIAYCVAVTSIWLSVPVVLDVAPVMPLLKVDPDPLVTLPVPAAKTSTTSVLSVTVVLKLALTLMVSVVLSAIVRFCVNTNA